MVFFHLVWWSAFFVPFLFFWRFFFGVFGAHQHLKSLARPCEGLKAIGPDQFYFTWWVYLSFYHLFQVLWGHFNHWGVFGFFATCEEGSLDIGSSLWDLACAVQRLSSLPLGSEKEHFWQEVVYAPQQNWVCLFGDKLYRTEELSNSSGI